MTKIDCTWYLTVSHFSVLNPLKPDKVCVVFDAAAKVQCICLDDALMRGPDLLKFLPGVLFKFRQGNIGFTVDIQEI